MNTTLISDYVSKFNALDEENVKQRVDNAHALEWMIDNVPYFECSDKVLEETYYFRWWTYRKSIKDTPEGPIVTEFLPEVSWAGAYNSINAAAGFHLREGRWLRKSHDVMENYIRFFYRGSGNEHSYSSWLPWAVSEYARVSGKKDILTEYLPDMIRDYEWWEQEHFDPEAGLFYSIDDRDAMECSISGSGFRPTLNSYMYGNALAIAEAADAAGDSVLSEQYRLKAEDLKKTIREKLFRDGFYSVIPAASEDAGRGKKGYPAGKDREVRELIGFIPWYFGLPDAGDEGCFSALFDPEVFAGKKGLRTADASHLYYNYPVDHECLWNGPCWPYATSQTLVSMANLIDHYPQDAVTKEDYYRLLRQYAEQHVLVREDGAPVPWIDEVLDPEDGHWISRDILKADGWKESRGGYERGKDYNHSLFCDLVISGLFGASVTEAGEVIFRPKFPEDIEYARLDDLEIAGRTYCVTYTKKDGFRAGLKEELT